jgi:hypothetical protein
VINSGEMHTLGISQERLIRRLTSQEVVVYKIGTLFVPISDLEEKLRPIWESILTREANRRRITAMNNESTRDSERSTCMERTLDFDKSRFGGLEGGFESRQEVLTRIEKALLRTSRDPIATRSPCRAWQTLYIATRRSCAGPRRVCLESRKV